MVKVPLPQIYPRSRLQIFSRPSWIPGGVATRQPSTGMTGTMGVAATFSQRDAYRNGVVIGRDARALGVDLVLEPFVNIDRDPTWSRAFNTFGEDPLLTGQTGAGEITGIQSQGTMAMVKHFIAYDGGNNVVVDAATLHEIYLQPFADAIGAGVASLMCSYNTLRVVAATPSAGGTPGPYSCGNPATLTGILRGEPPAAVDGDGGGERPCRPRWPPSGRWPRSTQAARRRTRCPASPCPGRR